MCKTSNITPINISLFQSQIFEPNNDNYDTINKFYDSCGCITLSKLNILENKFQSEYLQICKKHFFNNTYIQSNNINKQLYTLNNNVYIKKFNNKLHKSSKLNKKTIYSSYEDLQHINNSSYKNYYKTLNMSNKLLSFGKYKNYTYDYVYNNDKLYCYNLAYWRNNNYTNLEILDFIDFIKSKISFKD